MQAGSAEEQEEERVAALLLEAMTHQREARYAEAEVRLAEVVRALSDQPELEDVLARAASLLAQARLETSDAVGARSAAQIAMRALRSLGDASGMAEVRALDERIAAELDRERRAVLARARSAPLADKSLQDVLSELQAARATDLLQADQLLRHAQALQMHDRHSEALESAEAAIQAADRATAIREQVLARITAAEACIALASPEQASRAEVALRNALVLADRADETTLIGLVARAAELAGVALPAQHGPQHHPPQAAPSASEQEQS